MAESSSSEGAVIALQFQVHRDVTSLLRRECVGRGYVYEACLRLITILLWLSGHVDFGVKWEILPLCLKGKFYANHAFMHKGKILRQGCRCVHNNSILRH